MPPTEARPEADRDPEGLLLVDKPSGPTSHDVVSRARRALDEGRVGHTGTLDPFATGLLLLLVGRATRLAEYFHRLEKAYRATLRLGEETDTHDRTGETRRSSEAWHGLERGELEEALSGFRGELLQRPPAYSAKQVEGRRAHEAAREGELLQLEPEEVTVHELELVGWEPPEAELRAVVGTGTYVRSLARDLGRELGVGAHLTALRRTRVGPFEVDDALAGDELEPGVRLESPHFRPPADAVSWLPRRRVTEEERRRIGHGQRIDAGEIVPGAGDGEPGAGDPVALVGEAGLVAVAELLPGALQPRKVFDAG